MGIPDSKESLQEEAASIYNLRYERGQLADSGLAVDDHELVRSGIAGFLAIQPDMTLVAEAANGREAVQQFRTHRPDVTLMDLQMPEMNGLDALIAIRAEFHDAKIIVLTTYEGDAHILRAVKAGAQGYLLKNTLH